MRGLLPEEQLKSIINHLFVFVNIICVLCHMKNKDIIVSCNVEMYNFTLENIQKLMTFRTIIF